MGGCIVIPASQGGESTDISKPFIHGSLLFTCMVFPFGPGISNSRNDVAISDSSCESPKSLLGVFK